MLKKHGAELIGFWTPLDDKDGKGSKLIYLVAFPDREAARKTWKEFSDDPEWKKVYAESHKNGVLGQQGRVGLSRADRLQRDQVIIRARNQLGSFPRATFSAHSLSWGWRGRSSGLL